MTQRRSDTSMYQSHKNQKRIMEEDTYSLLRLNLYYIVLQKLEEKIRLRSIRELNLNESITLNIINEISSNASKISREKLSLQIFFEKFQGRCKLIESKLSRILKLLTIGDIKNVLETEDDEVISIKSDFGNIIMKNDNDDSLPSVSIDQSIKDLELKLYDLKNIENVEFSKIADELLSNNVRWPYFKTWEATRVAQKKYYCNKNEYELGKEIEKYQELYINETKFQAQLNITQMEIDKYIAMIEERSKLYDEQMDSYDAQQAIELANLEVKKKEYADLVALFEAHGKYYKETRELDASILIQRWWRPILKKIKRERAIAAALEAAQAAKLAKKMAKKM